jgi:hypothetical protein
MRIANYDSTFNLINCIVESGDKFYVTVDGKRQETQTVTENHIIKPDSDPATVTPCYILNDTRMFLTEAFNFTPTHRHLPLQPLVVLNVSPEGKLSINEPISNRVSIYIEIPNTIVQTLDTFCKRNELS